jgi:hypothetical protein
MTQTYKDKDWIIDRAKQVSLTADLTMLNEVKAKTINIQDKSLVKVNRFGRRTSVNQTLLFLD